MRYKQMASLRKIALIIVSLSFLVSCGSNDKVVRKRKVKSANEITFLPQIDKEDLKAKKLKVKSKSTYSYFYDKFGKVASKGYFVEKRTYDKNGNLSLIFRYSSRGGIDLSWKFDYDYYQNLTHKDSKTGSGLLKYESTSKFDDYGNEIEREEFVEKTGKYNKIIFAYDSLSNLLSNETFNSDDELISKGKNQFDASNNLVHSILLNKNGSKYFEKIVKYDSLNRRVYESENKFSEPATEYKYLYDKNGFLSEKSSRIYRETFKNDSLGNVIEQKIYDGSGGLQQMYTYRYKRNGLIKERIRYDGLEHPALYTKYEYEYYK